jgi:hypothetical protein
MRRIKSFGLFEAMEVPEHFIPLESIGHYLDTNSGLIYPILTSGGYENKGYPFVDNEDDWIDLPRISPEDMRLVDPFWKSTEGLIKPKLNWDLINAVKQIAVSEELIDHGCYVRIRVQADPINITLYYEMFGKDEKPFYPREFSDVMEQIASIDPSKIEYGVTVMKQHENGRLLPVKMDFRPDVENEGVRSMMMRLEDMYPDENIKFHQW